MSSTFDARQKRVLAGLVIGYSSAYICRTNISMLLPGIMEDMHLTQGQAGLLTTAFAAIYALGQVLNGMIVDKVNPRLWIFVGLTASCLCNLLAGFQTRFGALLAIWAINAVAQSMLWTPVVRILAQRFSGEHRSRASFFLSFALIIGNLAAWSVAGLIAGRINWRAAFSCCAALTFALNVLTALLLRGERAMEAEEKARPQNPPRAIGAKKLLLGTGLLLVLMGCLFNGFVRDSVMTWAPTILMAANGIDLNSVLGVSLIIPVVNFFGVLIGRLAYAHLGRRSRRAAGLLMLICGAFSLLLFLFARVSTLITAVLLSACVAMAYGLNPLLTALLPLEYYDLGRVGTVAGLVDAAIYVGSSLSGTATGFLAETAGWQTAFGIWAVVALLGGAAIWFSSADRYMRALYPD